MPHDATARRFARQLQRRLDLRHAVVAVEGLRQAVGHVIRLPGGAHRKRAAVRRRQDAVLRAGRTQRRQALQPLAAHSASSTDTGTKRSAPVPATSSTAEDRVAAARQPLAQVASIFRRIARAGAKSAAAWTAAAARPLAIDVTHSGAAGLHGELRTHWGSRRMRLPPAG